MTEKDLQTFKQQKQRLNGYLANQSPMSLTSTFLPYEAFVCSGFALQKNFEFENKIQSNNVRLRLEPSEKKRWNSIEQDLLLQLHNKLGNKWTAIAFHFPGRNHNSVKNYFYAQIRKSLRKLNFVIKKYLNNKFKPLNISHVSKMITLLSEKNDSESFNPQILNVKKFLFAVVKKNQEEKLQTHEIGIINEQISQIVDLLQKTLKQKRKTKLESNESTQKTAPKQFHNASISDCIAQQKDQLILNSIAGQKQNIPINVIFGYWSDIWSQYTNFYGFSQVDIAQQYTYFNNNMFQNDS